jgi:nucleoside-diphosphate-sugar epimerase/predicted dehydrogenase
MQSPNNRKWKAALLGAGYISEAHARALAVTENVELTAVCDLSLVSAKKAAASYNIPNVCTNLDDLLKLDIDVVHVLLPPDSHAAAAKKILESGRHVFLEKPMAISYAQCQDLVETATRHSVKLGVNHNFLFLSSYEQLREQVRNGSIGQLDQITANWMFALGQVKFGPFNIWMLREPKNIVLEIGSHLAAFVVDLSGIPDIVSANAFRPLQVPGGATVYRRWHAHGVNGNTAVDLNISLVSGSEDRSISIRGHAASVKLDYSRDVLSVDEPSGAGVHFDALVTTERLAYQYAKAGVANFYRSLLGKLRKTPSANPYLKSIENSVRTFYSCLDGEMDSRLDGQFASRVIQLCERVAAGLPPDSTVPAKEGQWDILPPKQKPTVLVIGGTGFIGKYLVKGLSDRGVGVRAITRSQGAGKIALAGASVELTQGDLNNASFLDKAMEGIEVVYHLAKVEGKKWSDYYDQDVMVTKLVAERAVAAGVRRFVYTGTIDSYYSANARETITSDTPLDAKIQRRNLYARSKAACEALLTDMHKSGLLPLVIFRPGIVIGKGCPPAHLGIGLFESDARVSYWGDGSSPLPLVLVEDVANALVLAMDVPNIEGQRFLLTDTPAISAREYVDIVSKETGTRIRSTTRPAWRLYVSEWIKEAAKNLVRHPNRRIPSYRDCDSKSHRARYDSDKTRRVLGWQPAGSKSALIQRGIVDAVRDFMK